MKNAFDGLISGPDMAESISELRDIAIEPLQTENKDFSGFFFFQNKPN